MCIDEQVAIAKCIQEANLESIHFTHPGNWGKTSLGQYAFWPYMHREIMNKAAKCKLFVDIIKTCTGKSCIQVKRTKKCSEPQEELQIGFEGPNTNEKDQAIRFLACIDHVSKYARV